MTGRIVCAGFIMAALAAAAPAAAAEGTGSIRAGVAKVDATWHVGSSAGQYASDGSFAGEHGLDPTAHSTRRSASYGIQSRLEVRAIVVEGPDGERLAVVKNDLYIPQDLLWRRTAQLLEQGDSGIDREHFTMAVSHNHSSPYYSSISWGVWAFQDVFDIRFYDYYARRMAEAVEEAASKLVPVRVGAAVTEFDLTHRHSYGGAVADDGTPAGYPQSDADHDLTVIRFDDVSDPANPKPLANLVNFALHPEFLDGNDLISADYLGPLERMADRETGAMTIFTQGAVGTAEPERSTYHSPHQRLEFSHFDYRQAEYGARLMADAISSTSTEIADGSRAGEPGHVPFFTDEPVRMQDRWYPGPFSHPYPGVSNCRTDAALGGTPGVPIVGLPDCQRPPGGPRQFGIDPGIDTDDLQDAGVPVPENYGAPSYTGLQEDVNVHLQAFRIGEILFTVCSCEQWKDQSENIETRTDTERGNEYLGYDWFEHCTQNGDGTYGTGPRGYGTGTWTCPRPGGGTLTGLSDQKVQRMHAQVVNPANGWNDLENAASAESEPTDLRRIKGNFTHDDDRRSARLGYELTVPIGMANDYNGYIASYREYQRGDHYRKALTGWGPHSMDYLATRLVTIGRQLKDRRHPLPKDQRQELALMPKVAADLAHNDARATMLGEGGAGLMRAYEALLPDDAEARALEQPADVERFSAAFFTWAGGSNFTDSPGVRVERLTADGWREYADMSGELPVTLEFPQGEDVPSYLTGSHEWRWTAHFEAFANGFDTGRGDLATPAGIYRFSVDGEQRRGGRAVPYSLTSESFAVSPWDGITVEDLAAAPDGTVSFVTGPRTERTGRNLNGGQAAGAVGPIDYPDSYDSPARFIGVAWAARPGPQGLEWYCDTCTWRHWLDAGEAQEATFTFTDAGGAEREVAASLVDGRWTSTEPLGAGETARVEAGAVRDRFGNLNGDESPSAGAEAP
ncbi:MAG TPA: hypothetical protein VNT32_10080 [Thermoleophilaceae bacterium]|nr:hypothetical protein [Thermoleophilaceae bacterium]